MLGIRRIGKSNERVEHRYNDSDEFGSIYSPHKSQQITIDRKITKKFKQWETSTWNDAGYQGYCISIRKKAGERYGSGEGEFSEMHEKDISQKDMVIFLQQNPTSKKN